MSRKQPIRLLGEICFVLIWRSQLTGSSLSLSPSLSLSCLSLLSPVFFSLFCLSSVCLSLLSVCHSSASLSVSLVCFSLFCICLSLSFISFLVSLPLSLFSVTRSSVCVSLQPVCFSLLSLFCPSLSLQSVCSSSDDLMWLTGRWNPRTN